MLSHGYYDAYYLQAQKLRRLIADDFQRVLRAVRRDRRARSRRRVACGSASKSDDPVQMYLADIFTLPANLAGLPGMSIPCGLRRRAACRSACSSIGNYFDEGALLHVAHAFQQATDWHARAPAGC